MTQPSILPPRGPSGSGIAPTASATPTPTPGEKVTKSSSDIKPLEGKTTIDEKLNLECEILCYRSLSKITEKIATEFHEKINKNSDKNNESSKSVCIIFLDETFKMALQLQQSILFQVDLLNEGFKQTLPVKAEEMAEAGTGELLGIVALPATATAATTAATTLGRSVIDLLALFRSDVSYAGRSVTIKETSLVFELARWLSKDNWTFLYPRLLLYQPSENIQESAKRLKKMMTGLYKERDRASDAIRRLAAEVAEQESSLMELIAQATDAERKKHPHKQLDERIADSKQRLIPKRLQLDAERTQFEALDSRLKALQVGLTTPNEKSGVVPLHMVQQAEELLARFDGHQTNTYFLWAEVSTAGGSYQIRKNLMRTLFWGDGLYYSGGAIVTYAFFDGNANVVLSGTHRYREPFTKFLRASGGEGEGNSL